MPTILLKKSDTPGSVPGTANLTNLAGGAEVAVNTADKRMFSMTSASAVIELGTNPSSLTCSDGSFVLLKAASASITNLTATSLVLSNLSIASANITTLTSASATITNLVNTSASITTLTNNPTFSAGTANGVLYLNGSKVATSGSALTFNGSTLVSTGPLKVGDGAASNTSRLMINNATNTATGIQLFQDGIESWIMGMPANSAGLAWSASGAEQMRLTSTGLGIGTSSPGYKLDVNGTGRVTTEVRVKNSAGNVSYLTFEENGNGNSATFISGDARTTGNMAFWTNSAERMRLDSSGNLGLGVTPSAWTSINALQVGPLGAISGNSSLPVVVSGNAYATSAGWAAKYITSGYATAYLQYLGEHRWLTAPSWNGTGSDVVSFTQAMTLDASGNLCVGVTSGSKKLNVGGSADLSFTNTTNTSGFDVGLLGGSGDALAYIYQRANAAMVFGTNNTERARITAGGFSKFSNTGTYASSTSDRHELRSDKNDINVLVSTTSTGSSVVNVYSQFPAGPNAAAYHFAGVISGSGYQFTVDADGDVKNTNGSYAAISDIKLKQDIEDSASQWEDIKSVRVRKYRFKRTPDAPLQIGVIAQELEQTSPGLVSEDADRDEENNDLGTTTKSVKYSILYMKAVKALQEAMARIEQLEAKVAALESA